jgi:hypothetical protein
MIESANFSARLLEGIENVGPELAQVVEALIRQ